MQYELIPGWLGRDGFSILVCFANVLLTFFNFSQQLQKPQPITKYNIQQIQQTIHLWIRLNKNNTMDTWMPTIPITIGVYCRIPKRLVPFIFTRIKHWSIQHLKPYRFSIDCHFICRPGQKSSIEDSYQTLLNLCLTDARTKAIRFAKNCWN